MIYRSDPFSESAPRIEVVRYPPRLRLNSLYDLMDRVEHHTIRVTGYLLVKTNRKLQQFRIILCTVFLIRNRIRSSDTTILQNYYFFLTIPARHRNHYGTLFNLLSFMYFSLRRFGSRTILGSPTMKSIFRIPRTSTSFRVPMSRQIQQQI